jgi:hypothetical protein
MRPHPSHHATTANSSDWLSLTDLGRLYGISAVNCGRLLQQAGLRQRNGAPSRQALKQGLAYLHSRGTSPGKAVWSRRGCSPMLEGQGLVSSSSALQVELWADLLADLELAPAAISTSAAEMGRDVPSDLRPAVNAALQRRGCRFRVNAG